MDEDKKIFGDNYKFMEETTAERIEDEIMTEVDKIPYIGRKLHKIGTYIWYLRWIFNMAFFAIPWSIFVATLLAINVSFNIFYNRWWAGGNLFLVT